MQEVNFFAKKEKFNCPWCGKEHRKGVKDCRRCGKNIAPCKTCQGPVGRMTGKGATSGLYGFTDEKCIRCQWKEYRERTGFYNKKDYK